ncbi:MULTISPECIES: ribosomal protein L7/L12 [unclassified Rhodococcus (in: high G+C Gram-positive bacteria)]|uniref:ribosomal protein L7/L12 n=1 Tax=unclassified Rhodococcus (in: high G+C Gram-positive bacteria) TaxID=192944 RepID=UPI0014463C4D|nr:MULTISPECIES: ribosomal protein L7/L12 [unclassified Rhodococcus (in: high G+C Gram-positive bacteria)]
MSSPQRKVLRRIVVAVVALCAAFLAFDGLTNGNWYAVAFAVFAAVMLLDWLRPTSEAVEPVDPSMVPADDVLAAISATDSRIPAIKLLRKHHPGLGLKDAKDLVDDRLGR